MTLSEGYETSTENGFSGLVNVTEGNQFVITVIPATYEEVKQQFTPEAIASSGVIVCDIETYITNGMTGTLYSATQTQDDLTVNKYILLFGNAKNTYMIMAVYGLNTPSSEILGYLETVRL